MKLVLLSCVLASFVLTEASLPIAQEPGDPTRLEAPDSSEPVLPVGGVTAGGAAFSLSAPLDRGHAVSTRSGWLLSGRSYRADLDAEGLRFVPTDLSDAAGTARGRGQLALSLRSIDATGEAEQRLSPSGPPAQPGGLFGTAIVTPYAADGLLQTVQAHPDGVELGVWMVERPDVAGDVRLVFDLEADLERLLVETTAGVHAELTPGGRGLVRIGRATAVDAAGRRTELLMGLTPDSLEVVLDAGLLATAAFPLWVDPKIGSELPISASPSTRDVDPDVVFDPITGEFLVVWERTVSAAESDLWGARVDVAGTVVGGPFPVDVTASTLATRPRIAVDPATGSYLVVYEDDVSGGPGQTVRWSLFDSGDLLVASQSFTISGYLSDTRPDVGYVDGPSGSSGFVLVHRRNASTAPDSTVQVTWIDAATAAVVDSQTVSALSPPRDSLPAVPQLAQSGATLVAFQRFDTSTSDLDVLASCVGLGAGAVTIGSPLAVSSDATAADGAPDVSVVDGTFQVVWERLILATSNRNLRGREVLPACAGFAGPAVDVTNLPLLEAVPALAAGRYTGACDGQTLVLFTTTNPPAGSSPVSVVARRWDSPASSFGAFETVALGQAGVVSFSTPRVALDAGSTALPRFLVVYDDDGAGTNAAAEVLGQLVTFDEIPLSAVVTPAAATSCVGAGVTFDATVTGSGSFVYQWRQDGVPIPGATASSYTIPSVVAGDAGVYDVEVTGACGTVLSSASTLGVDDPITGVTIAVSASPACAGSDVTLTASTATGVASSYGWFRAGVFLQVTSVPTLVLTSVQLGDAGDYTVTASNACGNVTSPVAATLEVDEAITGVTIAVDASPVCVGSDVTLTASTATGIASSYGWFRDGVFLQVTSVPTLVLTSVQLTGAGDYTVTASNSCGNVASPVAATLEIDEAITGVTIAVDSSPACVGSDVTLTAATATGIASSYGWFRDGVFLQVTSVPTLVLTSVQLADAGDYTVTASNSCGNETSPVAATLEIDEAITGVTIAVDASPVCAGSDVTLTASVATGIASSYGWFRDGVFLQVTSVPTLVLTSVQLADAGDYTVTASNSCGNETSPVAATLEVDEAITGVTLVVSASPVCAGSSATLTASTATGVASSYGWFRDGVFLQVTPVPTLVLTSVQLGDAGDYTVTASNTCGDVTSPVAATLEIDEAITGVAIAASASPVCAGTNVTLTASTTTGVASSYEWFRDSVFLQVTPVPTLLLTSVQPADAGDYTVSASNACGAVASPVPAILEVEETITGVTIAASASLVCAGTNVTLTAATATGVPSSYGWFRDGVFLQVTPVPTLVLTSVQPGDAGAYTVTADNTCGSVSSPVPAVLAVDETIGGLTIAASASPVCVGTSVTLTASVATGVPSSYDWFRDGVLVQSTSVPSLVLGSVQPSDAGAYTVAASNACGSVTSPVPAVLEVEETITGVTIAASASLVCAGTNVTLTAATATGVPSSYGWFRDGVFLQVTSVPTLVLTSVQPGDAGAYTVTADNTCGSVSSPVPAVLAVDETIGGLTIAASASPVCVGTSVTLTASVTAGVPSSYDWFRGGVLVQSTSVPTLVLGSVQPSDAGAYTVSASNACGNQTSPVPAVLEVDETITGVTIAASATTACAGTDVTLTASTATGVSSSYGWFRDGVFLQVTPVPTLVLTSVQPGDAGAYTVTADNTCGNATSPVAANVTVVEPVTAVSISGPASQCVGQPATFDAVPVGGAGGAISYQWYLDGVAITGATTSSLSLPSVQPPDAGTYTVEAGNTCGTVLSAGKAFAVGEGPTSVSAVASTTNACVGTGVTFTATVSGGTAPFLFEWFKDGVSLGPPTSGNTLSIASAQASDAGSYVVRASNSCGSADSIAVALDISEPPGGVAVSASATTFCLSGSVTLTATVSSGTGPLFYEWLKDGVSLGAPSSSNTFSLINAQPSDAGDYQVVVSNTCGSQTSAPLPVTYIEAPGGLSLLASSPGVCVGSSVEFTATLTQGTEPILYEWFKDGVSLGAPSASNILSIPAAQPPDAGTYVVRASNPCGTLDSNPAFLIVDEPPAGVSASVSSPTVCLLGSVTFSATVSSGTGPFLYEWLRDGVSLGPPSLSSTLTIPFAQASDAGDYQVIASNGCGAETSPPVTLTLFLGPTTYCTAKPSSLGCSSVLSWAGFPSATAGSGFDVTYAPVPGNSFGLFIYTTFGAAATPVQNAFGTLCLDQTSILRAPTLFSGGSTGSCNGDFTLDFNAFFASPSAPPILQPGVTVDMQCWYRDPPSPGSANLSNAISFLMCP